MLPNPQAKPFLIDSGLETTLVFHENVPLRDFASFEELLSAEGRARLAAYAERHAKIAEAHGSGFLFETATWRASQDWGDRLGYDVETMAKINRDAVAFARAACNDFTSRTGLPGLVTGCVGPRGDGYIAGEQMSPAEAQSYHSAQVDAFADAGADMVGALTMTYANEAIGIVAAAKAAGLPCAVSFTVETDGRLPNGMALGEAIESVDRTTGNAAAFFMVNCAHPDHFRDVLAGAWRERIYGVRANASRMSHAELDAAEELDAGNPQELGAQYAELKSLLPNLCLYGGCCGTDHRHIEAIATTCIAA